jgi:hypothetical protein
MSQFPIPVIPDVPFARSGAAIYGIAKQIFPTLAVDVVGIFSQDFKQLFVDARAIKAIVKPSAKVMEHPVENGTTVTDFYVVQPIEIELNIMITTSDYVNIYNQIYNTFINGTLVVIRTRSGQYTNMLIYDMPHQEDPEIYEALAISLKLREVQFADTVVGSLQPRKPADKTTVDKGVVNPTTPTPPKQSFLKELFG